MFDSLHAPADLGSARARLRSAACGLAGGAPIAHLRVRGPGPTSAPWPAIEPGASVVVADIVLWRTTRSDLRLLAGAIGPEQALLFLEPTADVGWRRLAHRSARSLWRRGVGHHFEVDVPVELRAAGLDVVDVNRFGLGPLGTRSYVLGRAMPPPDGPELSSR